MIRSYSELVSLPTFAERYTYLKLEGLVGEETFGSRRFVNQDFYRSYEWQKIRREVILRDNGLDLGVSGIPIAGQILIHHMNPLTLSDFVNRTEFLTNPEYLICVSKQTHNALHYGSDLVMLYANDREYIPRFQNDTSPWRLEQQ